MNWLCPKTRLFYASCRCGLHRCGYCGRRRGVEVCPCEDNRRRNRWPAHSPLEQAVDDRLN